MWEGMVVHFLFALEKQRWGGGESAFFAAEGRVSGKIRKNHREGGNKVAVKIMSREAMLISGNFLRYSLSAN